MNSTYKPLQLAREWISTESQESYMLAAYYAEYALADQTYTPMERLTELQSECCLPFDELR